MKQRELFVTYSSFRALGICANPFDVPEKSFNPESVMKKQKTENTKAQLLK